MQTWRLSKLKPFLVRGARVLDVGCADGVLFRRYASLGIHGVGLDPCVAVDSVDKSGNVRLIRGSVCDEWPGMGRFDVIVMLAVLEHIPASDQPGLAARCAASLNPVGRVVITVPSPKVDGILDWLIRLGLADGMSVEEHYGFSPDRVRPMFEAVGLRLKVHETFQLGLNHLFVFEKPHDGGKTDPND